MIAWWILFALVLGTVVFVRVRLLAIPLERDEGEYAYAGQLMLRGIPPYEFAYNMKFPGTYAAYALIMAVFGQTPAGIHFGLLLINLATIALVYFIASRLMNRPGAIVAAAAFAVLSVTPSVLGLAAHAEHFVMLPALGATLLLLDRQQTPRASRIFASGALFGLAVLMKQPAIFFLVFGGCYLLYRDFRARIGGKSSALHLAIFAAGAAVPLIFALVALWVTGVLPKAWFWTVNYARAYGSTVPLGEGMLIARHMTAKIFDGLWPLGILALLGVAGLLCQGRLRQNTVFIALLLLASGAALSSGLYFREHYYVCVLPILSLLVGVAVAALLEVFGRWRPIVSGIPVIVVAAALIYPLVGRARLFLFFLPKMRAPRSIAETFFGMRSA